MRVFGAERKELGYGVLYTNEPICFSFFPPSPDSYIINYYLELDATEPNLLCLQV